MLQKLEDISDAKSEIRVLKDKKEDLINELMGEKDYEFQPYKKRLSNAIHEQSILNKIKALRIDL